MIRGDVVEAGGVGGFMVSVENLGCEIEAVRPHDGASLLVDAYLSEVPRVVERFHHGTRRLASHVLNVTNQAVVEQQPHHMRPDDGDADNMRDPIGSSHGCTSMVLADKCGTPGE